MVFVCGVTVSVLLAFTVLARWVILKWLVLEAGIVYVRAVSLLNCTTISFEEAPDVYIPVISMNALLVVLAVSGIVTLNVLESGDPLVIAVSLPTIGNTAVLAGSYTQVAVGKF